MLPPTFFHEEAITVAPKLLGTILCRRMHNGQIKKGVVVETEAYMPDDPACHAARGITKRTIPMFEQGGISYVYFIYGMYHCFNTVTGEKGSGQAVLIRALHMLGNEPIRSASGPGKLCRYLEIDRTHNSLPLTKENGLWFEENPEPQKFIIETSSRIGISIGKEKQWRFFIQETC